MLRYLLTIALNYLVTKFSIISIQFNSDICTRQLLVIITLAHTAKKATLVKYMNEKRKQNQL